MPEHREQPGLEDRAAGEHRLQLDALDELEASEQGAGRDAAKFWHSAARTPSLKRGRGCAEGAPPAPGAS